ncbi:protein of unknown function (plasmid) [Cupriavidus neocaledonicus]|uniref:Uncharacterized protein n=1 Tax=Cupriavidus neocaledonicus TaxID=1040979 RepID=A0A375HL82_9BURK|nr:protein of unknown function [Cupriavidus neocaledonicus]
MTTSRTSAGLPACAGPGLRLPILPTAVEMPASLSSCLRCVLIEGFTMLFRNFIASLRVEREPARALPASHASVPDSPDQSAQRLLVSLLHGGRTLLQDLRFREQHQFCRAPEHQRDLERRARRERVAQEGRQEAFDAGTVCRIHANARHRGADPVEQFAGAGLLPPCGCARAGTCRHDCFSLQRAALSVALRRPPRRPVSGAWPDACRYAYSRAQPFW